MSRPFRHVVVAVSIGAMFAVAVGPAMAAQRIVFTKEDDVWTIRPGGRGLHRLTRDPAWQHDVAWSPDHRSIAYVEGGRTLMLMDRLGGERRELLRVPDRFEEVGDLTWAPRGNRLAFSSARFVRVDRGTRDCGQVWIYSFERDRAHRIVGREPHVSGVSWSPGGERLAVGFEHQNMTVSCGGDRPLGLATVRTDGSHLVGLGLRLATHPDWAPGGRRIAFRDWRNVCHACGELWTVRPDGDGERLLTEPAPDEYGIGYPAYSPSGSRLAALGQGLWIVDASGGRLIRRIARMVETVDW